MSRITWTEEELKAAVVSSNSVREVLGKLNLAQAGGNYASIKRAFIRLNINTEHFNGQAWSKGQTFGPIRPLSSYLSNEFTITSHKLRLRLIREGYKEAKCEICKLSEWLGKPIALELDHIDGNHVNNSIDNLQIICPNCHAQTSTYRGRNRESARQKKETNI